MPDALIGCTGFVGTTLAGQHGFANAYRSTDIETIEGREFDLLVCAGAPAQKWIANREPEADRRNLQRLIDRLGTVRCRMFVLISTVDVFVNPVGVTEQSPVAQEGLHAYGRHRLMLEEFVVKQFPGRLVVRLPGLVGRGLRKNAIFDFLNDNNLDAIDSRSVFQFYPMANLWRDIGVALGAGLELVHLTAEPVSVAEVASEGFGRSFDRRLAGKPAAYDLRTRHASTFGGHGHYQYSRQDSLRAIRDYADTEPRTAIPGKGAAR